MAEEGRRPGGLTALAVLNFVFSGFGAIGALLTLAGGAIASAAATSTPDASVAGEVAHTAAGLLYFITAILVINVILLISSGIGYIQQKRFLGRTLGNVYGLLAVAHALLNVALLDADFGFTTIIGLIYPVLTLLLLNTVFKYDFIR